MKEGYLSPIDKIIDSALEEDLGPGDVTTGALVEPFMKGEARLIAK